MFALRRFGLAVATLPLVALAYGAVYFGLALLANSGVSTELFTGNLWAIGFAWVVVVTFAKQILDFVNKIGE